jgi:serine/threonine protein kinase
MQKYYKYSDKDKLKYLCMLDEFGNIKVDNYYIQFIKKSLKLINLPLSIKNRESIGKRYYAIMENCGTDLSKYFETIITKNYTESVKYRLKKLINIFKECCKAVKIIHDLGYLHLDIKPQNFLISNKEQIKIIDFGESQKVGYPTNDLFGTSDYIANDLLKNHSLNPNEKTTLQYHHDIFSLGCMFVELLFKYVLRQKFNMVCPLKKLSNKENFNKIISERKEYDIKQHNYMLDLMKKDNINGNIITLIDHMVNPEPFYRFKNINQVIEILNNIDKNIDKYSFLKVNNDTIKIKTDKNQIDGEILFKRNDFTLNNIKVGKEISGGSFATIYKIDNKYVYKEYVVKKYFDKEMNGLIFHAFLESEYKDDKLKYLCKLYEFGRIGNVKLYGIMENCGIDMYKYVNKIIQKKSGVPQIIFEEIFKVFKECCDAVKIIHELKYLHLDIKPNNFVITNKGQVKIIDFGESQKFEYQTKDLIGTSYYIANNWIENYSSNPKKETTLQYHHDIFSLGYTFVDILYRLCKNLNNKYIEREPENESLNQLKARRNSHKEYVKEYFEKYFEDKFKKTNVKTNVKDNIITLIDKMVNPDPNKRYENIKDVITQIDPIISELK